MLGIPQIDLASPKEGHEMLAAVLNREFEIDGKKHKLYNKDERAWLIWGKRTSSLGADDGIEESRFFTMANLDGAPLLRARVKHFKEKEKDVLIASTNFTPLPIFAKIYTPSQQHGLEIGHLVVYPHNKAETEKNRDAITDASKIYSAHPYLKDASELNKAIRESIPEFMKREMAELNLPKGPLGGGSSYVLPYHILETDGNQSEGNRIQFNKEFILGKDDSLQTGNWDYSYRKVYSYGVDAVGIGHYEGKKEFSFNQHHSKVSFDQGNIGYLWTLDLRHGALPLTSAIGPLDPEVASFEAYGFHPGLRQ